MTAIQSILADIIALPYDWHGSGTVSNKVLEAFARHASAIPGEIRRSVETGAGRSTLLLSHLAKHHTAFAVDIGGSMSRAQNSPLLRKGSTTFVEGPTQRTLARHDFGSEPVQIALIDGPHGWPFPELEYYYLYPLISSGGLLIVDDVHIPSIGKMLDVLKVDDMWKLVEVVDTTAFLVRTDAPTFDPYACGWSTQGYNRACFERTMNPSPTLKTRALRRVAAICPAWFKAAIPAQVKAAIWR